MNCICQSGWFFAGRLSGDVRGIVSLDAVALVVGAVEGEVVGVGFASVVRYSSTLTFLPAILIVSPGYFSVSFAASALNCSVRPARASAVACFICNRSGGSDVSG